VKKRRRKQATEVSQEALNGEKTQAGGQTVHVTGTKKEGWFTGIDSGRASNVMFKFNRQKEENSMLARAACGRDWQSVEGELIDLVLDDCGPATQSKWIGVICFVISTISGLPPKKIGRSRRGEREGLG